MRRWGTKRLPTDLEILDAVYKRYYKVFKTYSEGVSNERSSKIYVPLDIIAIAKDLGVDADILFGRLYYDLDKRHGYERDDGVKVPFFYLLLDDKDRHCINFPYMAAVLAGLRDERSQRRTGIVIAVVSLVISGVSLFISLLKP